MLLFIAIAVVVVGAFAFFNNQNGLKIDEKNGSLVSDVNGTNESLIGGQRDEHGCLGPAGYSWNATEKACVREWLHDAERYQNMSR